MTPRDRLARLHAVNTLFHRLTGHDLFLAEQVLSAIEAAQADGDADSEATATQLDALLRELHERLLGIEPDAGFAFCDGAAGAATAGPLFVRSEVLSAIRRNAPYKQATIMVANLPGSAEAAASKAPETKAARARAAEHAEEVAQLRDLTARHANPRSLVTLLVV